MNHKIKLTKYVELIKHQVYIFFNFTDLLTNFCCGDIELFSVEKEIFFHTCFLVKVSYYPGVKVEVVANHESLYS
jgi:hypothetical protein